MSQFKVLPIPAITVTPTGTQDVNLTEVGGATITEGQKTMANSIPVVIASDQSAVHVIVDSSALPTGAATQTTLATVSTTLGSILLDLTNGTQITQISGTVPLPTGSATAANQATQITAEQAIQASTASIDTKTPALGQALAGASVPVVLTAAQVTTLTPPTTVTVVQPTGTNLHAVIDAGANIIGTVGIDQTTQGTTNGISIASLGAHAISAGNGVSGMGVLRVAIASDNTSNTNPFLTAEQKSTTSTLTNVAGSATTVSILASNANRKGAMIFNDSTATLYLKFGTTASTTSYTVQIASNGYYEFPANPGLYTGACDGIWSAANGSARITELS